MEKKRDVWVDNVKVVACILVVLGHFFQSMMKSGIIADSSLYRWFDTTIYYFHVPLFFICSGFLYQKYSKVSNAQLWLQNLLKKLVALGIPYFVFSLATWVLKKMFSSSVNDQLGGLGYTLFKHPASPYWYLYILFAIFVITVTTKNLASQIVMLVISLMLKLALAFNLLGGLSKIYLINKVADNWIWFVLGMLLVYYGNIFANIFVGWIVFAVFILGSIFVFINGMNSGVIVFGLAIIACYSIISIVHESFKDGVQDKKWQFFAKYTMPIFLMHTLFAAPLRSVLLKVGLNNSIVQIVMGLIISFCGPVVAMIIMDKIKPLDFIVYPGRYIRLRKRS